MPDGRLRGALMGEEIELEAPAQHRVFDLADAPLPGRACIRDEDIDAAMAPADLGEGCLQRLRPGHVAGEDVRAGLQVEADRLCALGAKGRHDGLPDGAGRARHHGHLSGERRRRGLAELGLFERPVFDVEQVLLADAGERPDAFGVGNHLDRGLGEVGGDGGRLRIPARREEAHARREQHARRGVQRGAAVAGARIAALEIGEIVRLEPPYRRLGPARELVQPARPRRGQQHGPRFNPERMVGGDGTGEPVAGDLRAVHETADTLAAPEGEHETLRLAAGLPGRPGEQAAQHRRDPCRVGRPVGQRGACKQLCRRGRQMRFRAARKRDHALIGLARGLAERERAVVQQDHRPRSPAVSSKSSAAFRASAKPGMM